MTEAFASIYQETADEVLKFWSPELQDAIAVHNAGWSAVRFDFAAYLRYSLPRYERPYRVLPETSLRGKVVDIGGLWGVFPIVLRRFGYDVVMTEALRYYGSAFNRLFDWIRSKGVQIIDLDPFVECDLP